MSYQIRQAQVVGGTITDQVDYELPLGALGRVAHWLFVRRQLDTIFAHRQAAMARRFPLRLAHPQPEAVSA